MQRPTRILAALLALGAAWVTPARAGPDGAPGEAEVRFVVIAHPNNPAQQVSQRFLAEAFLRKISHWPSGAAIRPVVHGHKSPVRRAFDRQVLNRSVGAVENHWRQLVFSGRGLPPTKADDDAEMLRLVSAHPGAIGYIAAGTELRGVKALAIEP